VKYLYPHQILFLHQRVLQHSGGLAGLRDENLLESAVYRPMATFGGRELYIDLFSKVAALGHSLIQNHPFADGNKRTGFEAMRLMLRMNGMDLVATNKMKFQFVISIATGKYTEQEIADWLHKKCKRYTLKR
jgi:death-on-curing protein